MDFRLDHIQPSYTSDPRVAWLAETSGAEKAPTTLDAPTQAKPHKPKSPKPQKYHIFSPHEKFAFLTAHRMLGYQEFAAVYLVACFEQNLGRGLYLASHVRSGATIQLRQRGTGGNVNTTTHRDTRGQITSARKRLDDAAGTPFAPGWDASYAYDDIGNRVTWGQGSAQQTDLSDLEPTAYTTNALHQYTSISGINAAHITGQAPAGQEVKINGVTADRAGHFYHRRLQDTGRTDTTLPHWLEVEITASTTLPGPQEVTAQRSGHLWQPPIPEAPVHDHDGNLIEDGRWHYTWDAENRLVQMLTRAAAVTAGAPAWRLSFAYDYQSRRIQKKVEVLENSVWELRSDARFIYDGWNVVAEIETKGDAWDAPGGTQAMNPRPAYLRRSWLWGEDLSGTMTGAGGVGGLLTVTRHARGGSAAETYWALSDLNGNVTGLVSASSARVAVYEYDAFGRLLRENEPEPGLNPVRFSSKYQDVETGLVYYGFRYYSPEMGRWINRDPIEEDGGVNLYGMVGNDAVNKWDYLGLKEENLGIGVAAANRTIQTFQKSALAKATGITDAASILGALTGYFERIRNTSDDVGGYYTRYTKTVTYPSANPPDDIVLHELVHVFNHQQTGIGGWPMFGNSLRADEGMAYYLQVIYAAAAKLKSYESILEREMSPDNFSATWKRNWSWFWDEFGKTENYPFKAVTTRGTRNITFIDELHIRDHLKASLNCKKMIEILNKHGLKNCVEFSCDENGPVLSEAGFEVIYTGVKLPFYQK